MGQDDENITESRWREEFRQRIIESRGKRSQADMAYLLGLKTNTYGKYEGSRKSVMPVRLLPKFAKICAVDLEWLIEGDRAVRAEAQPKRPEAPAKLPKRKTA